jgi:hypothetical protein
MKKNIGIIISISMLVSLLFISAIGTSYYTYTETSQFWNRITKIGDTDTVCLNNSTNNVNIGENKTTDFKLNVHGNFGVDSIVYVYNKTADKSMLNLFSVINNTGFYGGMGSVHRYLDVYNDGHNIIHFIGSSTSFLEDVTFEKDINVGGNLDVTQNAYVDGELLITGFAEFDDDIEMYGKVNMYNNLTISNSKNIDVGSITGTKIATSNTQKLGFFGVNPVTQQGNTVDLGTVLSNLGFRVSGSAYPITTSGAVKFSGKVNCSNNLYLPCITTGTSLNPYAVKGSIILNTSTNLIGSYSGVSWKWR